VDGKLDEEAWAAASWTEDFLDIEGVAKPKPRYTTRAKMLWDDEYLYVGAEMEEPHVWATLTEHDSVIFQDNDFEVFIDPNGDNHDYFEFEINALNTGWDLRLPKPYRDGGPALNDWEIPGLESAVHIRGSLNDPSDVDDGWSVEIAFPWTAFAEHAGCPAPPSAGDQWRVNFSRVQWTVDIVEGRYVKREGLPEDNWVWSPQYAVDMHRPEYWGYVQFEGEGATTFREDPDWGTRMRLMALYEAQQAFRGQQGRWADSTRELGIEDEVRMFLAESGWRGSLPSLAFPGRMLTVRHDSRLELQG
jgi:hypothetical protein